MQQLITIIIVVIVAWFLLKFLQDIFTNRRPSARQRQQDLKRAIKIGQDAEKVRQQQADREQRRKEGEERWRQQFLVKHLTPALELVAEDLRQLGYTVEVKNYLDRGRQLLCQGTVVFEFDFKTMKRPYSDFPESDPVKVSEINSWFGYRPGPLISGATLHKAVQEMVLERLRSSSIKPSTS